MRLTLALGLGAFLALPAPARAQEVPKDVQELLVTLKSEKAPERAAAARILGELGPAAKDAVPGLQEALLDADKDVRRSAARSLGDVGRPAQPAVPALGKALKDGDAAVRQAAAYALGRIGDPAAKPFLEAAKKDTNEGVKRAAKDALKALKKKA
ncbi:MAG TPA: HEAT repeat domain-containing protein [Vicinamibacteria bacterium]